MYMQEPDYKNMYTAYGKQLIAKTYTCKTEFLELKICL